MVLSLAFILAFIGSAVALVIGILIFSDVSEAMSLTLPILDFDSITDLEQNSRDGSTMIAVNTAHLPSTYNNLPLTDPVISVKVPILGINEDDGAWFAREHCASGVVACSNTNENRVKFQGTGVSFQMNTFLSASVLTDGYLGKVFDKAKLANKEITIEVSQGAFANSAMTARIYDGVLNPSPTGACGIDCFPTAFSIVTSGSGGFVTLWTMPSGNQPNTFNVSNSTLAGFDSPTGKVTLVVVGKDTVINRQIRSNTYTIDIQDLGTYRFTDDLADPLWNGTFPILIIRDSSSGLNPDDYEIWASRPPIVCDFDIGLYDSSLNLLASEQGMVFMNVTQDIVVDFTTPVAIPPDGIISVGIIGERIFFEGSTNLTNFDSGVTALPDPFVSDGTVASSQTTILVTEHTSTNTEQELNEIEAFNRALNVAFTVIGIVPVAMFFFLFAIFGGRTE